MRTHDKAGHMIIISLEIQILNLFLCFLQFCTAGVLLLYYFLSTIVVRRNNIAVIDNIDSIADYLGHVSIDARESSSHATRGFMLHCQLITARKVVCGHVY